MVKMPTKTPGDLDFLDIYTCNRMPISRLGEVLDIRADGVAVQATGADAARYLTSL